MCGQYRQGEQISLLPPLLIQNEEAQWGYLKERNPKQPFKREVLIDKFAILYRGAGMTQSQGL